MSANEIRTLLHATPFRPFTVYLASEKAFRIPHPESALLTPGGRTLVVAQDGNDAVDLLDVPLIARVEVAQPASA